ncbi:MAG: short chain dehydrogenase, partial [Candidatus Thermoplasmatota archaeon]|nr:short chain dehydrogenase [Candidatus Thermoplasmatota archaeon]
FVTPEQCRKPDIVSDAAYVILSKNSKECTGNFFIDENVLKAEGEEDLDKYAVKPGSKLFEDLYLD